MNLKKITLTSLFSLCILAFNTLKSQDKWELPMKNDVVYFQFKSPEFKNTKKALKNYYFDMQKPSEFTKAVNSKIQSELSKKGGKYFSTTDYMMIFQPITGGDYYRVDPKSNTVVNKDTIIGNIIIMTITRNNHALHIFGDKSSNFTITGKIKMIFTQNTYDLRIMGFTIKNLSPNYMKGTVQQNEAFLEDSYKEFLNDKKKDKAVEKFYIEFKELLASFSLILTEQLERDIKINEMD